MPLRRRVKTSQPFAIVIALIVTVGNLQGFAFLQSLTGGGPFYSSEVMELYIYRMAFGTEGGSSAQRLGYASAPACCSVWC